MAKEKSAAIRFEFFYWDHADESNTFFFLCRDEGKDEFYVEEQRFTDRGAGKPKKHTLDALKLADPGIHEMALDAIDGQLGKRAGTPSKAAPR